VWDFEWACSENSNLKLIILASKHCVADLGMSGLEREKTSGNKVETTKREEIQDQWFKSTW
jgi:hypothetical protein